MKTDVFTYELREVSAKPVIEVAGYQIKPYQITYPGPTARQEIECFDMARMLTQVIDPITDVKYHGLGFAILHLARDGTYLLVGRWYDGNNLMSESFRVTGPEHARQFEKLSLFACIWEMAVYHHERCAWITTVMSSGEQLKGAQKYLDCRFSGWV